MASQAITLLALCSLSVVPERPLRNAPTPNGPQPEFVIVQQISVEKKLVLVRDVRTKAVPAAVTEYRNGKAFVKTVYRHEYYTVERAFSLEGGAVYTQGGKKVSTAEALKRLKVGDTILVATQPVDPIYLRIIRPGTLILVLSTTPAPLPIPAPPKDKRGEPPQ
jgi:hypothetical protein